MHARPLFVCSLLSACAVSDEAIGTDTAEASSCVSASSYTPYGQIGHPSGAVDEYPWTGEAFERYAPPLPATVECASAKGRRTHLDVTAGCLRAVEVGGKYARGQIVATADGAFRALALGRTAATAPPVKWTDQSIEYRFHYKGTSGAGTNPGFKAFARYRSEDDLYVASWRVDGVAQIQKKQCGKYTALAVDDRAGVPSAGAWHRLRFDAIGDELALYLDDELVLAATDPTFSWGTAGIRADAMNGAYLDDWRVD